jgi:hypothetical protein
MRGGMVAIHGFHFSTHKVCSSCGDLFDTAISHYTWFEWGLSNAYCKKYVKKLWGRDAAKAVGMGAGHGGAAGTGLREKECL